MIVGGILACMFIVSASMHGYRSAWNDKSGGWLALALVSGIALLGLVARAFSEVE